MNNIIPLSSQNAYQSFCYIPMGFLLQLCHSSVKRYTTWKKRCKILLLLCWRKESQTYRSRSVIPNISLSHWLNFVTLRTSIQVFVHEISLVKFSLLIQTRAINYSKDCLLYLGTREVLERLFHQMAITPSCVVALLSISNKAVGNF